MKINNYIPREYLKDSYTAPSRLKDSDYSIRVGAVRELVYSKEKNETRYIVEVVDRGRLIPMTCTILVKFGGLFNYEEFNFRQFAPSESNDSYANFKCVAGDTVLVACINGLTFEGVILGCLSHLGRKQILPADGSLSYVKEFNGIQEIINSSGEYRLTFRGIQTNIDELKSPPKDSEYPEPEYDYDIGTSFYQFDRNGSYLVSDNSNTGPQYILLDKKENKILVGSGKTLLTIDKKEQSYVIENKTTTFNSEDEFNVNTKKTVFNSSDEWRLNTKKTFIDSESLIQAEAKDIKTNGKWLQEGDMTINGNIDIRGNIKQEGDTDIKGKFKTSDDTLLGGDKPFPLIYEIISVTGIGNMGAPVVCNKVKANYTKKTKAA